MGIYFWVCSQYIVQRCRLRCALVWLYSTIANWFFFIICVCCAAQIMLTFTKKRWCMKKLFIRTAWIFVLVGYSGVNISASQMLAPQMPALLTRRAYQRHKCWWHTYRWYLYHRPWGCRRTACRTGSNMCCVLSSVVVCNIQTQQHQQWNCCAQHALNLDSLQPVNQVCRQSCL